MIVGPVTRSLNSGQVYETVASADHVETRSAKIAFDRRWGYFVVPRSDFTGFSVSRQRTTIDDDEPASGTKRQEQVIQNRSGVHEFVVSIGYENGVNPPLWQMRVLLVTSNNVHVALMVQSCSDPKKRQGLFEDVHREYAPLSADDRGNFQREVSRPRSDVGDDAPFFSMSGSMISPGFCQWSRSCSTASKTLNV
jgi:hypothetical protein